MDKNITDIKMSFRVKLSYITHTDDNVRVFSKFWKIALLILSCGKYNLQLTKDKCDYVFENHSRCLFSRKIKPILDNNSEMTLPGSSVINHPIPTPIETSVETKNKDSMEVESRKFQCSVEGVDNLIKEIGQTNQDGDYKKDVTLMFNDCVNTCNHEVLNKLVSYSSKNPEKLPAEWILFDSIDKKATEKYVLNLMQTGDNQLDDDLYKHVLIKNQLIDVKFGNNHDGRLPPLLLAIVSNNKDSLNALLRLNIGTPIKTDIETDKKTKKNIDLVFINHDDVLTELTKHYLHDDFGTIYNYLEDKLKTNPVNDTRETSKDCRDLIDALRYGNLHAVKFLIEVLKKTSPDVSLNDYKLSRGLDYTIMNTACLPHNVSGERFSQLGDKYNRSNDQFKENRVSILKHLLYTEKLELNDGAARILAEDNDLSVDCLNLVATYMKNNTNVSLSSFIELVNRNHMKNDKLMKALAPFNNQDT